MRMGKVLYSMVLRSALSLFPTLRNGDSEWVEERS
jgi:hypothetical protein